MIPGFVLVYPLNPQMVPEFASEVDRLRWLVHRVIEETSAESTYETPLELSGEEYRQLIEIAAVAGAFVRQILEFARLILGACEKLTPSAAGPTERALYEYWAEFRYILSQDASRYENVLRLQLDAALDFTALLKSDETPDQELSAKVQNALDIWQSDHPSIFALVNRQRAKKPIPHWSGRSRSEIFRAVDGPRARRIYKMLSWEGHPIMGPARDWHIKVDAIEGGIASRVVCQPSGTPEQLAEPMCYRAGGMLLSTWNQFAAEFGGDPIVASYPMLTELSSSAPSKWLDFSTWVRPT